MNKCKFKLNRAGVGELLKSAEMQELMSEYGSEIASRAGSGYSSSVHNTGQRQAANVFPADESSARDNYKNNTLLKVAGV